MDGHMKQRIRVVGIAKRGDEILLLKKSQGRGEESPEWELLTGKIRFGEQPEEAMTRTAYEYLGIEVTSIKLRDVVTFTALTESSRQGNLYIIYEITLPEGVKPDPVDRYTAYKYVKHEEIAGLKLNDATISVVEILSGKISPARFEVNSTSEADNVDEVNGGGRASVTSANNAREAANGATVYVDGGSKGNPGPAAIGYYIVGEDGKILKQGGEFIGFATSRVAEYYAMKEGILQARELGLKRVRFVGDNLMMINQLRGIYQVKTADLLPIYKDIQNLLRDFEAVSFVHVKREQNRNADSEANKAMEGHFARTKKNRDII